MSTISEALRQSGDPDLAAVAAHGNKIMVAAVSGPDDARVTLCALAAILGNVIGVTGCDPVVIMQIMGASAGRVLTADNMHAITRHMRELFALHDSQGKPIAEVPTDDLH